MTAPFTPGAYLKRRREAAGLSFADVAAKMRMSDAEPEHLRVERLKLIEADAAPATFGTIVGLRLIYRFDLTVLAQIEAIAQGADVPPPKVCRLCACSENDCCTGLFTDRCWWVEGDECSSCRTETKATAA